MKYYLNNFYNKLGMTAIRRDLKCELQDKALVDMAIDEYTNLSINYDIPVYKIIGIIIKNSNVSNITFSDFKCLRKDTNEELNLFDLITMSFNSGIIYREFDEDCYDYSREIPIIKRVEDDLLTTDNFYLICEASKNKHALFFDNTKIDLSSVGLLCYQSTGYMNIDKCKEAIDTLNLTDRTYLQSLFKNYQLYIIPQLFSCTDFRLTNVGNAYDVTSSYGDEVSREFKAVLNDSIYRLAKDGV